MIPAFQRGLGRWLRRRAPHYAVQVAVPAHILSAQHSLKRTPSASRERSGLGAEAGSSFEGWPGYDFESEVSVEDLRKIVGPLHVLVEVVLSFQLQSVIKRVLNVPILQESVGLSLGEE